MFYSENERLWVKHELLYFIDMLLRCGEALVENLP